MKKIGILTHYYRSKNIGGLLQAYALTVFLQSYVFTHQICFDFQSDVSKYFKEVISWRIRMRHNLKQVIKKCLLCWPLRKQNAVLSKFENFIPHSGRIYNTANIAKANADYDIFITGSDQVFASYLLPLSAFYGEFTSPDKKVISYAASSDVKQFVPKAEQIFIKKLARLNAISVREKTLQEYIERITDKKASVVLDPTFLLSSQEWLQIANPKPVPQKPYIFCYFLGGKSAWQRQKAREYADKYGYELVHLPYIVQNIRRTDRFLKGQARYDVGPREFISLINSAQCVFTDSFHGLAFSINFGKNFYVFNRNDEVGPQSMNARITDTLATFGLTERHITDTNAVLDNVTPDFRKAHAILAKEKEKSINWLLNALDIRRNV